MYVNTKKQKPENQRNQHIISRNYTAHKKDKKLKTSMQTFFGLQLNFYDKQIILIFFKLDLIYVLKKKKHTRVSSALRVSQAVTRLTVYRPSLHNNST